ncbi:MAG: tripartite tricarboxylate transporter substrate-binding protein [Acetobacteraceae bacterium]|nr:tripartite tricarboxylate transporter substrate-binding protein [Acetobacteraceae bacterium]
MLKRRRLVLAAAGALAAPSLGATTPWPDRPVVLVVPSIAGGSLDTLVRLLADPLRAILGQPVVVENRGGAGGAIGADYVAKSPPEANRFLASAVHHAILPAIARLPYDSAQDLTGITDISASPNALIVPSAHPARSVAELVAWARANPGAPYATGGQGTLHHLTGVLFASAAGLELSPVHYRGSAPAIPDLIAGRVAFMFETLPSAAQQIRAGAVRALAVTGPARAPNFPELPTMTEAGFPQIRVETWYGLHAPRGVAPAVAERLRAAVAEALAAEPVRRGWEFNGVSGGGRPVAEFQAFWLAELAAWGERARAAGLTAG